MNPEPESQNLCLQYRCPSAGVYRRILIYLYIYICIYVHIYICIYVYLCTQYTHTCACLNAYDVCMCTFTCRFLCVYAYIRHACGVILGWIISRSPGDAGNGSPATAPMLHMGGCQNYGPLWGPLNTKCRIVFRIQKGTIILTTTHILQEGIASQG